MRVMMSYIDQAENNDTDTYDVVTQTGMDYVRHELARLTDPKCKSGVHENRQGALMRFGDARLRTP